MKPLVIALTLALMGLIVLGVMADYGGPSEWGQVCVGRVEVTPMSEPDTYYVACLLPINYPYRFPVEAGELMGMPSDAIPAAPPTSAATGVLQQVYYPQPLNLSRR